MSAQYLELKEFKSDNNLALKVKYCLAQKHRNISLVYLILKAISFYYLQKCLKSSRSNSEDTEYTAADLDHHCLHLQLH